MVKLEHASATTTNGLAMSLHTLCEYLSMYFESMTKCADDNLGQDLAKFMIHRVHLQEMLYRAVD